LADHSKKDEANVQFKKLQRAEDGKKAMSEYESEGIALRKKTERLKALRLAKEATDQAAAAALPAKKKPARKTKAKAAPLSDWLKDREGGGRNN
jgi:hypothetical protein